MSSRSPCLTQGVEKILNSTTGDRESVSGEGGEDGCFKCGGVKFRSMVKL